MSYNGSGVFNINTAGQPVVTGTVISSTAFNALTADLGTGLSTAITKDGQTVATARIPFAAGINSSLVTDATSTTTGSIITAGGVGIAKALFVGTTANIAGTTTLAGVTATSITDSGLTSGRVTYAGTAGLLQDSANLTFNGTTLTANTIGAFTLSGTVAGGGNQLNNVIIGTTTPLAGAFTTLSASSSTGGIIFGGGSTSNEVVTITNGVSGGSNGLAIQNNASNTSGISFPTNSSASTAWVYMKADGRSSTTGFLKTYVNDALVTNVTSTGLAVTGTLSATGVSSFSAGAIGAPSIYLSTDTTTGLYRIGANNVGFAVSGAKLLDMSSSGFTVRVAGNNTLVVDSSNVQANGTLGVTGTGQVGTTLGVGAATPSASGAGITFPATQSASTDANTLDDYEEGTFTPSLGGTATYSTQIGRYTKVGRMVTINFDIIVAILGTGSTTVISGLPFTASATGVGRGSSGYFQSLAVNVIALTCYVDDNASTIGFISLAAAGGTATINPAIFGNGARVQGSVCYFA